MTVFELIVTEASLDSVSCSHGSDIRVGLFSTREKAESKIKEIKKYKYWKMYWHSFRVDEVTVQ